MFASVDADGFLDVWDINKDMVKPIVHKKIGGDKKSLPLNAVRWSTDGRRLVVGDAEGYLSVLQVDADLAVAKIEDFENVTRSFV